MSYIEVNIGGKVRGLTFSQATKAEIIDRLAKLGDGKNLNLVGNLVVFCGLYIDCLLEGTEVDFNLKTVCEWAEKMDVLDLQKISNCYKESIKFELSLPKKKITKKKLNGKPIKANVLK